MIRIGYPCMNLSVGCSTAGTVRLANYTEERFVEKVEANLDCLKKTLEFNEAHGIAVYRVSSNLIPYASHPVQTVDWRERFADRFRELGAIAQRSGARLSTHPGQFVLINAPRPEIVAQSAKELEYQADLLELLGTDSSAKIQIHVGGVYGGKADSIARFAEGYAALPERVKERLVIENDERLYTLEDCMAIHDRTGVPVLFDAFHHSLNPGGLGEAEAFSRARGTWKERDGTQQIDFSQQHDERQVGAHSYSIEPAGLEAFLNAVGWPEPLDVMLEVKDKEQSVLRIRDALGARVS